MTEEQRRLGALYPILLEPHNPAWKEFYLREEVFLRSVFGDSVLRVSHIGSTAVEGLVAKPTIDILLEIAEIADLEKMIASMPESEYICLRRQGNSLSEHDLVMFIKGYTDTGFADKVFHIHVRHGGDWNELYFRDYLTAHPDAAEAYGQLKLALRAQYEHDRDGYTAAKGEFVRKHTALARLEFPGRYAMGGTI